MQEHERKQRSRVYSNFMLMGTGNRSLSNHVFERHTSTGSGLFAILGHDFEQIFKQIVSFRVKIISNTNLVASRLIKREKDSLPLTCVAQKRPFLRTVLTIVTAHIFCACQGSRVRRERNTQHAGQQQTYKENLLCYHLLLILKPCYNYHCICASSRVHSEIWGKNNFLSFF